MSMRKYKRILLIDDDVASLYINRSVLQELDLVEHIDVVTNGSSALNYFNERNTTPESWPDIILLDISMPVKDGFEVLAESRKLGYFQGKAPKVIMLTSSSRIIDHLKASEYGVVDYLTKPLTTEKLISALSKLELNE